MSVLDLAHLDVEEGDRKSATHDVQARISEDRACSKIDGGKP